ncbi:MAG: peroxiredoxin family protein [Planctomycetota bacterium]
MTRFRSVLLASLLAALPFWVAAGQDGDEPPPGSAAAEVQAIDKEYEAAQEAFWELYEQAKTEEERNKLIEEKHVKPASFFPRLWEIVEKHPGTDGAAEALSWIAGHGARGTDLDRALEILGRDHMRSEALKGICVTLRYEVPPSAGKLLRRMMAESPHREVKGLACYNLAKHLQRLAGTIRRLKGADEKTIEQYRDSYGAEIVKTLQGIDPETLLPEAEGLLEQVLDRYQDLEHYRGDLGHAAKGDLFELRNLAIGKVAPEIEGEDIFARSFRLSEYRGKVVVLDFWGNW